MITILIDNNLGLQYIPTGVEYVHLDLLFRTNRDNLVIFNIWTSAAWTGSRRAKVPKFENNYLINFGQFLAFFEKNAGESGSQRHEQFTAANRFTPRFFDFPAIYKIMYQKKR